MTTSIALFLAGWVAGWCLSWRVPRLRTTVAFPPVDDVAVVIPARNEADTLPVLLDSLARRRGDGCEVVVVDDGSDDGTGRVARDHGATVVPAGPTPSGWTGKAWACRQGVAATRSSRLVFADADVRFAPGGLSALVEAHDAAGGLVSVAPYHRMVRPVEYLSAPFNMVAFMGVGAARPFRHGQADGAFGPCIVCRRSDYERVGGHESVRESIVEDVDLARAFAARGMPVHAYAGRGAVEIRMYPGGLPSLLEGWSKNIAGGARRTPWLRSVLIALWVTAMLVPVGLSFVAVRTPDRWTTGVACVAIALAVVQQRVVLGALTSARWLTALLFPLTTTVFVVVFVRSLWLTFVRRRVRWRGRDVAIVAGGGSTDAAGES